jgi:predicted regulator of Ras-like GTPase activity (Roadblock/LC7/MglB family)
MTTLAFRWLLSGLAAGLFFYAGVLFAALRARRAQRVTKPLDTRARGESLKAWLDRESAAVSDAVIADELGLVVAAKGDYGDALAAYGAYIADVGERTRDALPLQTLRRVIIQDDHDTTLTVQPLNTDVDRLALVTLANGNP